MQTMYKLETARKCVYLVYLQLAKHPTYVICINKHENRLLLTLKDPQNTYSYKKRDYHRK
jgi:hypothetical protein